MSQNEKNQFGKYKFFYDILINPTNKRQIKECISYNYVDGFLLHIPNQ